MDPQPHRRKPPTSHDAPPPDNDLRRGATQPPTPTTKQARRQGWEDAESETRITLLDILRILGGLLLLSSALSYFITRESLFWNYRPSFTRPDVLRAWLVRPSLPQPLPHPSPAPPQRSPHTSNPPPSLAFLHSPPLTLHPYLHSSPPALTQLTANPARTHLPHRRRAPRLRRHQRRTPHLRGAERDHLRRVCGSAHVRTRRLVPFLRGAGRDAGVCDGVFCRGPGGGFEGGGGDVCACG